MITVDGHKVTDDEWVLLSALQQDPQTRNELTEAFNDVTNLVFDGCTASPDRLPPAWMSTRFVKLWIACVVHDHQYHRGGPPDRKPSDQMLRSNWLQLAWFAYAVGEIGQWELALVKDYAPIAYLVVRLFGDPFWGIPPS